MLRQHYPASSCRKHAPHVRSYDPVRLPPGPPSKTTLRALSSSQAGLPRLPETPFRRAVPTTPADQTGASVDFFPVHAAFPKWPEGRHPHCHFRGLLRLHSRYGPHACSTAQGGLCHGASTGPVARPRRPLATSAIDNSLGGTLLHKCFAQSRRTRDSGLLVIFGREVNDHTGLVRTTSES